MASTSHQAEPKVRFSYAEPTDPALKRLAVRSIEFATGQPKVRRLYNRYDRREDFFDAAVKLLKLRLRFNEEGLANIPKEGPLMVVANHPFGVVDGLVVSHLIGKVRPDYRVVAHGLLTKSPESAKRIFPIDFSGKREAIGINIATRKQAKQWLDDGHVLVIFPAGGVSTAERAFTGRALDTRWRPFTAKLIHTTQCPVLPLYTAGQNSRIWQIASQYSETMRAALFFHEVRNKIGRDIHVTIGDLLPYPSLAPMKERQVLVDWLYEHVYNTLDASGRQVCAADAPLAA